MPTARRRRCGCSRCPPRRWRAAQRALPSEPARARAHCHAEHQGWAGALPRAARRGARSLLPRHSPRSQSGPTGSVCGAICSAQPRRPFTRAWHPARTRSASPRPPSLGRARRRPSLRSCAATWLRRSPPGSSAAMRSSMSRAALCSSNSSCSRSRCARRSSAEVTRRPLHGRRQRARHCRSATGRLRSARRAHAARPRRRRASGAHARGRAPAGA
jgi:hypothetical protein